jgi:hypothetical protein
MDAFVYALSISGRIFIETTIPKSPSIIAIKPPVLVPPIKSKYSHGLGVASAPDLVSISSIISRRIKSDDSPRTPPPSRESILGRESSVRDGV